MRGAPMGTKLHRKNVTRSKLQRKDIYIYNMSLQWTSLYEVNFFKAPSNPFYYQTQKLKKRYSMGRT